ncbi:MAG TPA: DUF2497 domain-containing protein [Beijerinckiaceae bacterium]|jgi:hypothetical protein
MEEILASIRRIIADDQEGGKTAPAPNPAPAPAPPPAAPEPGPVEEDVLELAEVARPVRLARPLPIDEEPPEVDFREIEDEPEPAAVEEFRLRTPEPPPLPFMGPPPRPEPRPDLDEALLSQTSHAAVGQAFNMLAHTVLSSNARTLEDLVREMLRPMLKNWLDDNLPTLVERLVRAEIERVARGGR